MKTAVDVKPCDCGGTKGDYERGMQRKHNGDDDDDDGDDDGGGDDDDDDDDDDASDSSLLTFHQSFHETHETCIHKTQLWQHDVYATTVALHRCNWEICK